MACFERHREHYEALVLAQEAHAPLRSAMEAAQAQYNASQQAETSARQRYRRTQHPEAVPLRRATEEARMHAHAVRQAYRAAMAAHRDQLRPQHIALLDTLWAETENMSKGSPLAWYHRRLMSDRFRRAVERFLRRQGGPPQRKHVITHAHLIYYFTGVPLTWERLLGGKTSMLRIAPVPEWVGDESISQSVRRKAARTTATLRISDRGRATACITVDVVRVPGLFCDSRR